MKITMIGTGYVGLVSGTCFANAGNEVTCLDVDQSKIDMLNRGDIPIYEPGLEELVSKNVAATRLRFTTDYAQAIASAQVVFICVGTPQDHDGSADLKFVRSAAEQMAPHLASGTVVVCKSTVPIGTNRQVRGWIEKLTETTFYSASNPEFLKEGVAIDDFTHPDRVVVGVDEQAAADLLEELYQPFLSDSQPFISMGIESAEMVKYTANCVLATKISFINEMANLCELIGADINDVRQGIGHDQRIGFSFFQPGVGYGGSCFPKDVRALSSIAGQHGFNTRILKSVDETNTQQKSVLFQKLLDHFDCDLAGRTVAIWGLAFKPETDDIREAPALVLIDHLLDIGAKVRVHDPVAMENVKALYGDRIAYCQEQYETCQGAEALCILTEWDQYRKANYQAACSLMKSPVILDGRNLFDPESMAALGIEYEGIGLLKQVKEIRQPVQQIQ